MKWTDEKVSQLRDLNARYAGVRAIADEFGVTTDAVYKKARATGIHLWRRMPPTDEVHCRARWASLIGPMKQKLRNEILNIIGQR